jgi:glycerol-3-phosphate acyltransferase PlsY
MRGSYLARPQTVILCQFDARFKPELRIAVRTRDMYMHSRFFARIEEKFKTLFLKDSGTQLVSLTRVLKFVGRCPIIALVLAKALSLLTRPRFKLSKNAFIEGQLVRLALIIPIAYLLGSIPFGYLIVRAAKRADIRETGSGGTGATNVSRRAGKGAGVLTLALDVFKGAVAVVIARIVLGLSLFGIFASASLHRAVNSAASENANWWLAAAAVAVIVGHIFPVWLRFRGGKGVATGVGVFLMLAPSATAFAGLVFFVIVLLTRYVSLGSIVAAAAIPLLILIENHIAPRIDFWPLITAAVAGAALIIFAHRANIERLIKRSETRFE